jgi:hypothetical protein
MAAMAREALMVDNGEGPSPESANVSGGKGGVYMTKALARARKLAALSDAMIDYLASVVRNTSEQTKHRVAAARVVVEEHRWHALHESLIERAFLARLGTPEKALAWLDDIRPRLEAQTMKALDEEGQ